MCSSTQTNLPHRLRRTPPPGFILLFRGKRARARTGLPRGGSTQNDFCHARFCMKTKKTRLFCASLHLLEEILYFFFQFKRDVHARPRKDEQERNGDENPHEDKSRAVHGQLRAGWQGAGQVSWFVCIYLASSLPGKTPTRVLALRACRCKFAAVR